MNKSQLFKQLSGIWSITEKDAKLCVDSMFDVMAETLAAGGRIEIRGFGSFKVKNYQPYEGRNPKTGDLVQVPEKRLPVFKMSKRLKSRINKEPTSLFR
jgi:integration host factor subunit beta